MASNHENHETAGRYELFKRAALCGPGYRGERLTFDPKEASELAARMREAEIAPPSYLESETRWIDRKAKLFEAGEYPDKGLTIRPSDIQRLAANFDLPVPVLIEHAESPLELGYLTQVEACGNELFGTVALTEEAEKLVQKSGAGSLSLGLSPDLNEIREVSLVRNPRIPSARLFADGLFYVTARLEEPIDWKAQYEALCQRRREEEAESALERYVKAGKLLPAQVPFAQALLMEASTVEFNGDLRPVRQLLIDLIERQLPSSLFTEAAPQLANPHPEGLMPEETEFYRRYFPDLSLDAIAKRKAASRNP